MLERVQPRSWFTARASGRNRAEVLIYDDVGAFGISARDFLERLKALGDVETIDLRVNSLGGDVFDGIAIHNALSRHPARIEATIDGLAASIASIIVMAADEIAIPENAWMMIHDPSAFVIGTSADMSKMAETLDGIKNSLVGIYAKRTGRNPDDIHSLMDAETWMDGPAAVDAGFADRVLEPVAIAAHADLSRFHNPPAALCRHLAGALPKMTEIHDHTPETAVADAATAERQRVLDIMNAGRNLGLEVEAERMIVNGTDAGEAAKQLIEAKARRDQAASAVQNMLPAGNITVGFSSDEPAVRIDRMAEALAAKLTGKAPSDAARQFTNMSVVQCVHDLLATRGIDTRGMSGSQIVNAGMHSTSDFPELLRGTGNRILLDAYQAAESGFKRVSRLRPSAPDFRPLHSLRAGGFGTLPEVLENGEVTSGTRAEVAESFSLSQFAKIFALSQQAVVNDDLMAFADFARIAGQATAATEGALLYSLLDQNSGAGPTMSDTKALFHTDHGNLAASGGAISATTLGAARQAMREQKDIDGVTPIAVRPVYLVVGPASETIAEQVLNPLYLPTTQAETATQTMRSLEIVVEPRISDSRWYLFAAAGQTPTIEHAYLDGAAGPQLQTKEGWETLGVEFRAVLNFGVGAVDFRGAYKNAG